MHLIYKRILLFLLALTTYTHPCQAEGKSYSIVFVYLGEALPSYLPITVSQARLFNPEATIYLLLNESALWKEKEILHSLEEANVLLVTCERLSPTESHLAFSNRFESLGITHYHRYTTERFFYINELMQQEKLTDVFQLEADVMLYTDLKESLELLHKHYPRMAAPFQNDVIASVSFTYFANAEASDHFTSFISTKVQSQYPEHDMALVASYKNEHTDFEIDHLPTVPQEYFRLEVLKSTRGDTSTRPWKYWNHVEKWGGIFDPDGLGTLLTTRRWEFNQALIDPELFYFKWEKDEKNRKVPYLYAGKCHYKKQYYKYRINTLHIYPKNFEGVYSLDNVKLPSYRGSKWKN